MQKGFSRIYAPSLDEKPIRIEDVLGGTVKPGKAKVNLLIDRIVVKEQFDEDDIHRLADSIQTAFYESEGEYLVEVNGKEIHTFNNRFEADGIIFDEPTPNLFSFNNPYGACPTCEGFGQVLGIDEGLVIPDKRLSVYEGGRDVLAGRKNERMAECVYQGCGKI